MVLELSPQFRKPVIHLARLRDAYDRLSGKFAELGQQKFQEMQDCAVRWGFKADDVGLVTGNRRVNPDARILVVVAEILLNRLLHPEAFDFHSVAAVVMGLPYLKNFLPLGTTPGAVSSSGTIALISFFVGVEVAAAFILIVGELVEQTLLVRQGDQ